MKVAVVRENGMCDVYVNGVVNEELRKMKERYEKELSVMEAKLQSAEGHRDDLLTEKLTKVKATFARPVSNIERIREKIIVTWCQIYGMGMELKLWGRNKD